MHIRVYRLRLGLSFDRGLDFPALKGFTDDRGREVLQYCLLLPMCPTSDTDDMSSNQGLSDYERPRPPGRHCTAVVISARFRCIAGPCPTLAAVQGGTDRPAATRLPPDTQPGSVAGRHK